MVQYTLKILLPDTPSSNPIRYMIDLITPAQESHPETVFTSEIKESMRKSLQKQGSCRINDTNLQKIIQRWVQDIKEGYPESQISLNLPSAQIEALNDLQDSGNQEIPNVVLPDMSEIEPIGGILPPLNFV
jgi:hypothetical protein